MITINGKKTTVTEANEIPYIEESLLFRYEVSAQQEERKQASLCSDIPLKPIEEEALCFKVTFWGFLSHSAVELSYVDSMRSSACFLSKSSEHYMVYHYTAMKIRDYSPRVEA